MAHRADHVEEPTAAGQRVAGKPGAARQPAVSDAAVVSQARGARVPPVLRGAAGVRAMQGVVGNGVVMRMLDAERTDAAAVHEDEEWEEEMPAQLQRAESAIQRQETVQRITYGPGLVNRTGLPDGLKHGVEELSGLSLDDVRVHYDSSAPARVGALAYAQGTEIHVAPGQERHLPHEAWHIVQQKQGRVRPTLDLGGVAVNDDTELEHEAEAMGQRAAE